MIERASLGGGAEVTYTSVAASMERRHNLEQQHMRAQARGTPTAHRPPPTAQRPTPNAQRPLRTTYCPLRTTYCPLPATRCPLPAAHCPRCQVEQCITKWGAEAARANQQ